MGRGKWAGLAACLAIALAPGPALAAGGGGSLPVPGKIEDLPRFLDGRWGDAKANWEDQDEDWIFAPCRKGHPRADAAYMFFTGSDQFQVVSFGQQGADEKREPVVSPVGIAPATDPAQAGYDGAALVAPILFEQMGWLVAKAPFLGLLVVYGPDRIMLVEPNADGTGRLEHPLVRCGER